MKNFIITLLSAMALSMSAFVFAGGMVVDAPTDANPAAQVAPVEETEVTDATEATECDAEKEECAADTTADADDGAEGSEDTAAADNTDSPVQVAPAAEENSAS